MNHLLPYRRRFLRQSLSAIAGGSFLISGAAQRVLFAADEPLTAATLVRGKDARLIVQGADPIELETPLALLREQSITPKSLLFVRNNQVLAGANTLAPPDVGNWTVELAGLLNRSATITVKDLQAMPQVEHEMVLQCSGNGRTMFSEVAPAKGAQWQCGAMGNVRFRGVPLAKALEKLDVQPAADANFLTAEGKDAPAKAGEADFEHSIPLVDALARSILALSLNGEPLPAVHGGPVRLVTPGYYATMNVKWLTRLRFEVTETSNHHQVRRYRTPKEPLAPGSEFTCDLTNSDANWRMRTKSVIFSPQTGEQVTAGRIEVRGVAWNDGAARIESVDVGIDDGTWHTARIKPSDSPYAWQPWTAMLYLPRGEHRISARATDSLGRSQPLSAAAHWNPSGYACNAVHTVKVIAQ